MESKTLDARLRQYNDIMKENDELYRDAARKFGLSECAFWILYYLRTEYGEPTQSGIGASFYLPKQSINSALKKLEAEGIIGLVTGENRRTKGLALTAKGEKLCAETVDHTIEAEKAALGSLSEKDQEEFMNIFYRYTEQFKKNMQKIPVKRRDKT